jgi:hypothetical protein
VRQVAQGGRLARGRRQGLQCPRLCFSCSPGWYAAPGRSPSQRSHRATLPCPALSRPSLQLVNLCLSCLFALELLLKLLGLGLPKYLSDKFNIFDAFVVALSLLELGLSGGGGGGNLSAFRSMRVLKAFRVLRLFKMFRCAGQGRCR